MNSATAEPNLVQLRELTALEKQAILVQIRVGRRISFCFGIFFVLIGALIFYDLRVVSIGAALGLAAPFLAIAGLLFATAFFLRPYLREEAPWPQAGRYRAALRHGGRHNPYVFARHAVNLPASWSGVPLHEVFEGEITPPADGRRVRRQMLSIRTDDGRTWSLHDDAAAGKIPLHRTGWFSDPKRRWY